MKYQITYKSSRAVQKTFWYTWSHVEGTLAHDGHVQVVHYGHLFWKYRSWPAPLTDTHVFIFQYFCWLCACFLYLHHYSSFWILRSVSKQTSFCHFQLSSFRSDFHPSMILFFVCAIELRVFVFWKLSDALCFFVYYLLHLNSFSFKKQLFFYVWWILNRFLRTQRIYIHTCMFSCHIV